jgi:hypothetical protein
LKSILKNCCGALAIWVLAAVIASLLLSLLLFVITAVDVVGLLSHASDYFVASIEVQKGLKN